MFLSLYTIRSRQAGRPHKHSMPVVLLQTRHKKIQITIRVSYFLYDKAILGNGTQKNKKGSSRWKKKKEQLDEDELPIGFSQITASQQTDQIES